jgi:hypothetical protein
MTRNIILFFSIFLIAFSGCNQPEEDSNPIENPTGSTTMTKEQVRQMLLGSWYFCKQESIDGPICAGGDNETRLVKTKDLQYAGFRLDFTNISAGIATSVNLPQYNMYYNGGSGTTAYAVLDYTDSPFYNSIFELQPTDLLIIFDVIFFEGSAFETGTKIVSLTNDELVLCTWGLYKQLLYFKRSNTTMLPSNEFDIFGNYLLDNYKEVNSGVVSVDEPITDGDTYSFTNEISPYQILKEVRYKGYLLSSGTCNYGLDLSTIEPDGFSYQFSNTHLCSGSSNPSYKVHFSDSQELILRLEGNCNSYNEYHFTKIN